MKLVLDTDTGVDDAIAIVLALNSPAAEIAAITTVAGNAPVEECTRNCLLLVESLRPDAPPIVAAGAASPLARDLVTAPEVHGADGMGGELGSLPRPRLAPSPEPAHEVLVREAKRARGEATLIATGPLTNVAIALGREPDAVAAYRRIIVMGGAFHVPGNTGPVAEFNFYVDPEAAAAVLSSGLDVTLIPLDATTRAPLKQSELEGRPSHRSPAPARPGRDLPAVLSRALEYYMRREFEESGLRGGYMHDPLAIATALAPEIVTTSRARVPIVTGGHDRGRSVLRPPGRGRFVDVAFDLDEAAFRRLLEERVLRPVFGDRGGPASA